MIDRTEEDYIREINDLYQLLKNRIEKKPIEINEADVIESLRRHDYEGPVHLIADQTIHNSAFLGGQSFDEYFLASSEERFYFGCLSYDFNERRNIFIYEGALEEGAFSYQKRFSHTKNGSLISMTEYGKDKIQPLHATLRLEMKSASQLGIEKKLVN
jgi:hypothetical protein